MASAYIKIRNLSYSYGSYSVLDKISFDIEKGTVVSIIGPNGSGKSTLIKNIIGLLKPSKGSVSIGGKKPREMLGKIAYVPQKFEFDRNIPITVYEFMALEKCGNKKHGHQNIGIALERVALSDKRHSRLGDLSGGQFQRVMIARALLHEKEIVVFDEPANGVDVAAGQTMYDLIKEVNQKKKVTFIIVSHELSVVSKYSNAVLCLNKKMCCFGKPSVVINSQTIKELYGENAGLYHNH